MSFFWEKRVTFKSFISIYLGICVASGKPFLSKYPTKKTNVLYVDEENGPNGIKTKFNLICNGLGLNPNEFRVGFTIFNGFRFENESHLESLKKIIKENNIGLVIFDTFRRTIGCREDSADDVNRVFVERIRPLLKELDVTLVFLHHLRKGLQGKMPYDWLDELRGSSELVNYSDTVMILNRIKNTQRVILKHGKSRSSLENPDLSISLNFSGDKVEFICEGETVELLDKTQQAANEILNFLETRDKTEIKRNEINEEFLKKYSKPAIDRGLQVLVEVGKLERVKRGVYRLKKTNN
ncbi:MAG: AAA family ATPase [Candidatus Aenigmatarchaeota archaeon]